MDRSNEEVYQTLLMNLTRAYQSYIHIIGEIALHLRLNEREKNEHVTHDYYADLQKQREEMAKV